MFSGCQIAVFGEKGIHFRPNIGAVYGLIEKAMACSFIEMYITASAHGADLFPKGLCCGYRD